MAGLDGIQGPEKALVHIFFENVSVNSPADRLTEVLMTVVHCQKKDADPRIVFFDDFQSLEAVHDRHREVHENDVAGDLLEEVEQFLSVSGFTNNMESRIIRDQLSQSETEDGMIIRKEDPAWLMLRLWRRHRQMNQGEARASLTTLRIISLVTGLGR